MSEFFELLKEGSKLAANLAQRVVVGINEAVRRYFTGVIKWSTRLAIFAVVPGLVAIYGISNEKPWSVFYGLYAIWFTVLTVAELVLLIPAFIVYRRARPLLGVIAEDLDAWASFTKVVIFNGVSIAIFWMLFPIWQAPQASLVLLFAVVAWLLLPESGFANFSRRIYPTLAAFQLVLLGLSLLLQLGYPKHMDQWKERAVGVLGKVIGSPIPRVEITSKWKTLEWFNNQGEAQVWYSGSERDGYRLWQSKGYDPDTNQEFKQVESKIIRDHLVDFFKQHEIIEHAETTKVAPAPTSEKPLRVTPEARAQEQPKPKAQEEEPPKDRSGKEATSPVKLENIPPVTALPQMTVGKSRPQPQHISPVITPVPPQKTESTGLNTPPEFPPAPMKTKDEWGEYTRRMRTALAEKVLRRSESAVMEVVSLDCISVTQSRKVFSDSDSKSDAIVILAKFRLAEKPKDSRTEAWSITFDAQAIVETNEFQGTQTTEVVDSVTRRLVQKLLADEQTIQKLRQLMTP